MSLKLVQKGTPGQLEIRRNLAPVSGGERELRSTYLKPFNYACMDALSIMTAYASYDGVPSVANKRGLHPDCWTSYLLAL